jgi:hypothetical protein
MCPKHCAHYDLLLRINLVMTRGDEILQTITGNTETTKLAERFRNQVHVFTVIMGNVFHYRSSAAQQASFP